MLRIAAVAAMALLATGCAETPANQERADFFIDRSLENISEGRLALAESQLQQALELDGGHPAAYLNMGVVKQRMGQPQEAESWYRSAMSLDKGAMPALVSNDAKEGLTYSQLAADNLATLYTD